MSTIKRNVAELRASDQNIVKHLNQMTFKGIVLNNNPYDVDQQSFKNAKNVYVDDNGTLISRPPILVEPLPPTYIVNNGVSTITPILRSGYLLIDLMETGKVKIYVSKNSLYHEVVVVNKTSSELRRLSLLTKYHISIVEQFVIVFNNLGAKVLDVNNFNNGWRPLRDYCTIPVTKRVVGNETFTYPGNQFTDSHKEEYILSDDLLSILPEGTAEVTVNQSPNNMNWTLPNARINPEFRVLRATNIDVKSSDIVTTAININTGINVLAVARFDHVMLSYDWGQSFTRVLYPSNEGYSQLASVSNDGLHFFFVARDGVYRYTIGDDKWYVIRLTDTLGTQLFLEGVGLNNICSFNTGGIFSFVLHHSIETISVVDVYWQAPNLQLIDETHSFAAGTLGRTRFGADINPNTKLTKTARDAVSISMVLESEIPTISIWLPGTSSANSSFVIIQGKADATLILYRRALTKSYGTIEKVDVLNIANTVGVKVTGTVVENSKWQQMEMTIAKNLVTSAEEVLFDYLSVISNSVNNNGSPLNLVTGYLIDNETFSVDGIGALPSELQIVNRLYSIAIDRYFYTVIGDKIYTNKLAVTDTALLVFTRNTNSEFTMIPTTSYFSTELYLGFNNKLKITANTRKAGNLILNLPNLNDHSFSSDINTLLNISTTEVAVFLTNKIYIATKVPDDLFGYRYDYRHTRLSIGTRLGDSVVNTLNGMLTLYPTTQGLAVMNYQPDVSNTDQVVEYVSNNIIAIWKEFYKGGLIKIVQMRDYVYLSNGTTTYLMLDLRGMTWWVMTSPFPVYKIVTNQLVFNIISNGLYHYYEDQAAYKDVGDRDIEWFVESQPNHFGAPSHYKNLKQLIFQLEEANNNEQTIRTQIKLYRKQFTLREPETIMFKVDSYRTFVKRFNYWKINELQWALAYDPDNANPTQLKLNGLTIKYEISEEVRS